MNDDDVVAITESLSVLKPTQARAVFDVMLESLTPFGRVIEAYEAYAVRLAQYQSQDDDDVWWGSLPRWENFKAEE